mgnify:CR=1 FL=1
MSESRELYEQVKAIAREKRQLYPVVSQTIGISYLRGVYRQEGIKIKIAQPNALRKLKAAYFNDEDGIDVLLNRNLPNEAKIFALVHELKHHYLDSGNSNVWCLKAYGEEPLIEKSAEVFAAEFLWPENEFFGALSGFGLTKENCTPENVVRFKSSMGVPVSYTFIKKRLEWFKVINRGEYDKVKFRNVECSLFGTPFYLGLRRR